MEDILQGAGLIFCIGGILLVILIAFGLRTAFGSRSPRRLDRNDPDVWRERGSEQPEVDSDRIESRGGFGNAPSQGSRRRTERDLDDDRSSRGERRAGNTSIFGSRSRRERDDDDDDVQSRGGFGG
jgi:hypothetical protein